jgi:hypothetical protein
LSKVTEESFDIKAKNESEAAIKTVKEMIKLGGEECEVEKEKILVNNKLYIVNFFNGKWKCQKRKKKTRS